MIQEKAAVLKRILRCVEQEGRNTVQFRPRLWLMEVKQNIRSGCYRLSLTETAIDRHSWKSSLRRSAWARTQDCYKEEEFIGEPYHHYTT